MKIDDVWLLLVRNNILRPDCSYVYNNTDAWFASCFTEHWKM